MHRNSELLFEKYAISHFASGQRVLEIGPDSDFTYRYMLKQHNKSVQYFWADYIEFRNKVMGSSDVDQKFLPFRDEYTIDSPDESFDIVFCGQVIEHVRKIWKWVAELRRVTRRGGKVIIINPVSWPYHLAPIDCWRIYPDGMKALFDDCDLKCVMSEFESLDSGVIDTISIGQRI